MKRRLRQTVMGIAAGAAAMALMVLAVEPAAAADQTASITVSPETQSHPTGTPQTYSIAASCQGTGGAECGPNTTITIPLDTTTTPPMTDPSWTFAATSPTEGLISSGPTVVGGNLVITLHDSAFVGGNSGSINLVVTPPNNITPNNTSWSIDPTITGDNIDPTTAPAPAESVATAAPKPVITKATADGGSVYQAGQDITYTINATCSASATGSLQFTSGSLTDRIPAGMTYVSSTPTATVSGDTITWSFPDAASTPAGCAPGAAGPNSFSVVLTAPTPAPPGTEQPLVNSATFSGTGPDATDPAGVSASTSASAPVQIVDEPPTGGGPGYASISKSALAPLAEQNLSGNQYVATYPGDWVDTATTPAYRVGAAAASFQTTVSYGLVGNYQTELIDPVPCLDDPSGNIYSSAGYAAAPCANPAFHSERIQIVSAGSDAPTNGLGAAVASGWRPTATLTDGTSISLEPSGTVAAGASSAYFAIPADVVGTVAAIVLPPDPALMNRSLQLTMWGYVDVSLAAANGGVNQLHNIATAIPQQGGSALQPVQDSADLFTVPFQAQLGIAKSFGATGGGPGGTTAVNITGAVSFAQLPLGHDIVLTDLLPDGMTWQNPVSSAVFTINQGNGESVSTATGSIEYLADYQGSGRDLVRMTVPEAAFATPGSYTITPPANLLTVNTPRGAGVYPNTDQIFLKGLGSVPLNPNCTTPTQSTGGTSTAQFESDNDADLAGDGNLDENHCQNSANLIIQGTGVAFALTKTVQGDLDPIAKGALGVGNASEGGTGTYVLNWTNIGTDRMSNPVIYDILPYVGDTGVSQGQSSTQRGSEFAPTFDSVGALPAGVGVEYSASTNPCRDEVYPDSANPGCVDDWQATVGDPADVKALRFTSSGSYGTAEGFSVSLTVRLAAEDVNKIAWNSAATNAEDSTDPSTVPLPAEPPKVGITESTTPVIVTSTSAPRAYPRTAITDTVTVTGTGGHPGTLTWSLVGPVAPVDGVCDAVDWSGAPVVDSGTVATTGDGTVTTGPVTVVEAGCYSWVDELAPQVADAFPAPPVHAAGSANEVTQVRLHDPSIVTEATTTTDGSATTAYDTVTVAGTGIAAADGSPESATATWTLHGPVAADGTSCTGVDWSSAPTAATGTLTITADGDYVTPRTTVTAAGCYSYGIRIASTSDSTAATSDPGIPAETFRVDAGDTAALASTGSDLTATGVALLALFGTGAAFLVLARRRRRRA